MVGPALLLAGAFQEASVIFVMTTPSVSRPSTTPMVDAVAVGAEVAWPMVLVQRGQQAGFPVVGWFPGWFFVGAFLRTVVETQASVRRTQFISWRRFCGGAPRPSVQRIPPPTSGPICPRRPQRGGIVHRNRVGRWVGAWFPAGNLLQSCSRQFFFGRCCTGRGGMLVSCTNSCNPSVRRGTMRTVVGNGINIKFNFKQQATR